MARKKSTKKKPTRKKPASPSKPVALVTEKRGNRRVFTIKVNSVTDLAKYYGVDRHTVRDWIEKGLPVDDTGEYDLHNIREWWAKHIAAPKHQGAPDVHSELKKKRLEQAYRKEELEYAKACQAVIPREHVSEFLEILGKHYRRAGDIVRKKFGKQAQKVLLDTNRQVEKLVEKRFNGK